MSTASYETDGRTAIVTTERPERGNAVDGEAARAWRGSPEYLAILPIREATSTSRVYIVDGYRG